MAVWWGYPYFSNVPILKLPTEKNQLGKTAQNTRVEIPLDYE